MREGVDTPSHPDIVELRRLRDYYGCGLNHVAAIYRVLGDDITRVEQYIAYDPIALKVKLLEDRVKEIEDRIGYLENPGKGIFT